MAIRHSGGQLHGLRDARHRELAQRRALHDLAGLAHFGLDERDPLGLHADRVHRDRRGLQLKGQLRLPGSTHDHGLELQRLVSHQFHEHIVPARRQASQNEAARPRAEGGAVQVLDPDQHPGQRLSGGEVDHAALDAAGGLTLQGRGKARQEREKSEEEGSRNGDRVAGSTRRRASGRSEAADQRNRTHSSHASLGSSDTLTTG